MIPEFYLRIVVCACPFLFFPSASGRIFPLRFSEKPVCLACALIHDTDELLSIIPTYPFNRAVVAALAETRWVITPYGFPLPLSDQILPYIKTIHTDLMNGFFI